MSSASSTSRRGGGSAAPAAVGQRLTALGPFFAADSHDPRVTAAAPWRELGELLDDPAVLAARVQASRGYLAAAGGQDDPQAVELRVAASLTHLALVARTLSPLIALAVLYGHARPTVLRDLRWQPAPGGAFPLSIAALDHSQQAQGADPDALAHALASGAIDTVAADLCALTRRFGVSERVLWGNVASAVSGAATMITAARPDLAAAAAGAAATALRYPALAGTYRGNPGAGFRRRNCCLIYRLSSPGTTRYCGDCILEPRPA